MYLLIQLKHNASVHNRFNNNHNNNRFLYSDFPGLRLVQTALQYTLLQFILFIITDNYQAPPRYMTDTYNGALFKFPNYL